MSYSKINDLRNIFVDNKKEARNGKKLIDRYIKDKNQRGLTRLLRYHGTDPIPNSETWLRDEVDYLLEYFSLLGLGHVTGYLSFSEIFENRNEIIKYLTNPAVRRYYYDHYPLQLPQVLVEVVEEQRPFILDTKRSDKVESKFYEFYSLNQSIDNDDVNQFLWFLDGGVNDGYDIDDFRKVLRNTTLFFEVFNLTYDDALRQNVRGFFMYLDFLQQFDLFLESIPNPIHRSAFWSYHAYWFQKINKRLEKSISFFFDGLKDYVVQDRPMIDLKMQAQIGKSQNKYLEILNRTVFNQTYDKVFSAFLDQWRGGGLYPTVWKVGTNG